jgi:fructose-bisphosphate aldolase, class II
MPVATADQYEEMFDAAAAGGYAVAAVNVTSSETLNAALRGLEDAGADGIVQITTGGAGFLSGSRVQDMAAGAEAFCLLRQEDCRTFAGAWSAYTPIIAHPSTSKRS